MMQFLSYSPFSQYFLDNQWIFGVVIIWSLVWKGIALWKSARLNERWWFIALLIINTLGILEIFYIFVFSKKKPEATPTAQQ